MVLISESDEVGRELTSDNKILERVIISEDFVEKTDYTSMNVFVTDVASIMEATSTF